MKKFLIVALFLTFLGFAIICNLNNEKTETSLIVKSTIELSVPEPSGLFFEKETKTFWTVSDENSTVYNLAMEGKVLKNFKVDELKYPKYHKEPNIGKPKKSFKS